jgi:RimJ/RimL family protein N-acetyltransferase
VLEVAETNEVARRLYAAAGFRAVGRRPDYYQRANSVPVAALTMAREMHASLRVEIEKTKEIEIKAQPEQSNFQD